MTQIIGFVAPKGSGKTTACNIIKKHLPDVVQINFKDALIEEIKQNFPDLIEELEIQYNLSTPQLFIQKPPLVRTLMQNYGTNVRRADNPHYWTNQWTKKIHEDLIHREKSVVCDDVRFLNEANHIWAGGGILIRLERTDLEQTDTHLSETEQKEIECDYTITCGAGELDKLEAELIKILDSVE